MFNYYIGNILLYSGLIGIGAGLSMIYIGKKYDVYEKSLNMYLDCNNIKKYNNKKKYNNDDNYSDSDDSDDNANNSDSDSDSDDNS